MSKPFFVVAAADLERGPRSLTWEIPEAFLRNILENSEAQVTGPGTLAVELSKNGREVMVRGYAQVHVTMPCVVTLEPLVIELKPEIFLLLAPAAGSTANRPKGGARQRQADRGEGASRQRGKPAGWSEDPELTDQDAARDTYDGERIVLDEFVREFILLDIPMYPRRSDLPSVETPAIAPPSEARDSSSAPVDPRLLPLAALASRLRDQKKE